MTRSLLHFSLLALVSLTQAAPPKVCPQVSAIATALSKASISVTPFCSSFLGIATKTSTVTLTSTPVPTTTDDTSTVQSVITDTTLITSTVTTATVATVTATSYSIDGSNRKRGLAGANHIPNPVDPNELDKRTLPKSTPKIPPCLTAFASGIISSACACLSIPTPTQTVTVSTALPKSTVTRTVTTTVLVSTTQTQQVDATATATATSTAVIDVCNASNNYGLIYSGGYATDSASQSGVGATTIVVPDAANSQACCAACYTTTGCYLFYLDAGAAGACTIRITQGGSSTDSTALCPLGRLVDFPASNDPAQGYYGEGPCVTFGGSLLDFLMVWGMDCWCWGRGEEGGFYFGRWSNVDYLIDGSTAY
ncbi:hypothetical protein G7Y79_00002g008430 [Physcia stellaris]|nr:hypothetical protein G7Y79_00002g008430 [Physcia stellaris]